MTNEEIFLAALEELSKEGNEKAKFALQMAERNGSTTKRVNSQVCDSLNDAHTALGRALRHNDVQWTAKTDTAIKEAQSCILHALTTLATK